ncbi:hypothetical protein FS837_002902 [Tulasnella sp. UAMH 9824]|nr:hypothetical protein FS837_002902 [Tulasnella sp. UAMH 9824]
MPSPKASDIGLMEYCIVRRLGALELPEILDIIMSSLDKSDLFVAGLVCQTWSRIAVNHIWRTLDSLVPLFGLLGPLALEFDGWRYTDTILGADWTRFRLYSQRIRKINNEILFNNWEELGPGALTQVVTSRPPSTPYVLPRITEIDWTETREAEWLLQLIPLLSPSLKSFTLKMMSDRLRSVTDARLVLRHLAFLPGLKLEQLRARWLDSAPILDDAVCDVLNCQGEFLKSFCHQSFNLDERLGTSLSQLPRLVSLELKFSNVTKRTDKDFYAFTDLLASKCHGLQAIRFRTPPELRQLSWFSAFQPLTRIKGLREIHLECGELDLKEQDLLEMGRSWRTLAALGFPNSWIPLPWFAAIANHFSSTLEGINVDIRVPEDLDHDSTILATFSSSLKRISYIEMASSDALKAVCSFLCRLVAPGTVVECAEWMEEHLKEVKGNSVKWKGK